MLPRWFSAPTAAMAGKLLKTESPFSVPCKSCFEIPASVEWMNLNSLPCDRRMCRWNPVYLASKISAPHLHLSANPAVETVVERSHGPAEMSQSNNTNTQCHSHVLNTENTPEPHTPGSADPCFLEEYGLPRPFRVGNSVAISVESLMFQRGPFIGWRFNASSSAQLYYRVDLINKSQALSSQE